MHEKSVEQGLLPCHGAVYYGKIACKVVGCGGEGGEMDIPLVLPPTILLNTREIMLNLHGSSGWGMWIDFTNSDSNKRVYMRFFEM